jgi:hypothetical protein
MQKQKEKRRVGGSKAREGIVSVEGRAWHKKRRV